MNKYILILIISIVSCNQTEYKSINEYKIDSVMQYVGLDKVYLNQQNFIVKTDENVYIDFNAIAKGYSVDLIKDLLININSNNFLIEVGGELITMGNSGLIQRLA